jgi:PAS domain-containing protein
VRIVIEDIQRKEQKLIQKRAANRKTAAASRSRKQQLIDELISSNAELRRQALVLSYLPDACMAIDVTGKIMFCSPQVQRILGYKIEEMEGANIERLLAPGEFNI